MGMKEFLMKLVLNNIYANAVMLKDETAYKILSDMIECKDCEKCHAQIRPCVDGKPTCIANVLLYYLRMTKAVNGERNSPIQTEQPEVIRCKECKHYQFASKRAYGIPVKMCKWFGSECVDDDDFCSNAEK